MSRSGEAPFGSVLLGPVEQGPKRLRTRLQLLLTVLLVTTHLIGAAVVLVISVFVLPTKAVNQASWVALAISIPVYVAAAVVVGGVWGTVSSLRAAAWALAERQPTEAERRRTLRIPLRLTLIQGLLWAGGFVVFTAEAVVLQTDRALGTGFAIAITGLMVSGIAYLFSEFALRPLTARALEAGPVELTGQVGVQGRMLLFWAIGSAAPVAGLSIAALLALTADDISVERLAVTALVLTAIALVFGLLITVLNARSVVAPITTVRHALDRVRAGEFDAQVAVFDGTELGQLQAGFNDMARGLREREAIRDLFGRHVGHEVAAAASRGATLGRVELGGETRVVSVLFIDLIGSTTYANARDPQEVVRTLNDFFAVVVAEVDAHGGLVNKFIGDAAVAIFGAPVALADHPTAALAAARRIAARLEVEVSQIRAGIGVATGEAVAGNIGDESRFEYTVIGDSVNSAARLCDGAKEVPGLVLVAQASVDLATTDERSHWQPAGARPLRGRSTPTRTARLRD
ncbi:adenylate/guanylate cyclase domain-containing protein [Marmoricola sp. RAF53]|uniref:adenylate/guanylate cyclase domain-containing protein n=1 Tax=Marmoricola sp. RAF53 TaxID=3233059 RepID=UPI003F9A0F8D